MKIEYKDADGRVLELEVSDEIGQFCLSFEEEWDRNERRNTRPDRHTSLETFVYEDKRFFCVPFRPHVGGGGKQRGGQAALLPERPPERPCVQVCD